MGGFYIIHIVCAAGLGSRSRRLQERKPAAQICFLREGPNQFRRSPGIKSSECTARTFDLMFLSV